MSDMKLILEKRVLLKETYHENCVLGNSIFMYLCQLLIGI